jgi:hypothetical protein
MKLDDIRLVLSSKNGVDRFEKKKEKSPVLDEELCNHPGCFEKGIVPDGGILYCKEHHFKCDVWSSYGEHACKNRVAELGDVCELCKGKGHTKRIRRGRRW